MSIAPHWIAAMPAASSMCGGLMIFTSSPYALCHQSSNGADVTIANAPQMHTQAPNGARKPQKRTAVPRDASDPANVVDSATHPHVSPATIPPR